MLEEVKEIQKGIIKWYPFRKDSTCLFIGADSDSIFELLKDSGEDYLLPKMSVSSCVPENIENCVGTYDYIVSVSTIEVLPDIKQAILTLSKLLNPNGHLLLGMNNRLGIRYFLGDRDPYTDNIFDGVENYRRAYSKKEDTFYGKCYDKSTLEEIFEEIGFEHQNYSVFPDLENAQMILRDDYESMEDFSIRLLMTYHHADTVFLEEEHIYNSMQKNGLLHSMANGFFFDCTFSQEKLDVLQITSSMGRAEGDSFFTVIHEDEMVEKIPAYKQGVEKLKNMIGISEHLQKNGLSVIGMKLTEKNRLVMPYMKAQTAQAYLKTLAETDESKFLEELDRFISVILNCSTHIKEDENGILLEKGYPDLVPLNCFYIDGEYVFFDQEFEIPNYYANMMVYRALVSMGAVLNQLPSKITIQDLYKKYGLKDKLSKWQDLERDFILTLRKEKKLAPYFRKVRRDGNKVYSNRLRMNFSSEEYIDKFVNIFDGLEKKNVLIFGSGNFAKQFMQMYGEDYAIDWVIDNRAEKHGEKFCGIKICGPEILHNYNPGEFRIIICIKNFLSVTKQLENMGIRDYGIFDPNQRYVRSTRKSVSDFQKIIDAENEQPKQKKYHVGYIAGVFDLFHVGHLEKFKLAKEQCDYLIVGLVTDEGVVRYKKTTPFVPFDERKAMLEACRYVDEVVKIPVDYAGTRDAWRMYGFDVQFSGSDYEDDPGWLADKAFLEEHGSTMVFFPYSEATSSSKLKELIDRKLL